MKKTFALAALSGTLLFATTATVQAQSFTQGFDQVSSSQMPAGWLTVNNSSQATGGDAPVPWSVQPFVFIAGGLMAPHAGNGMATATFQSSNALQGTLSNWLITPEITGLQNGDQFSFWSRTVANSTFPDRLEVRLSASGSSADVGSTATSTGAFDTLLLTINPTLTAGVYPNSWQQFTVTLSGLNGPVDGRLALRHFVTGAGSSGTNGNIIGIDDFSYVTAVPEPASYAMLAAGLVALGLRRRRVS